MRLASKWPDVWYLSYFYGSHDKIRGRSILWGGNGMQMDCSYGHRVLRLLAHRFGPGSQERRRLALRERFLLCPALFILERSLAYGVVPPTFRVGLPSVRSL